jgi:predicted RNase H-like HicB family nuclease
LGYSHNPLMNFSIEINREDDGRWIGEVPDLPGVFAYGDTRNEALDRVRALALRVIADRLEKGAAVPYLGDIFSASSASSQVTPDSEAA